MPRKKSSKKKGTVFEKLTASMYDLPGVSVQRNVKLPVRRVVGKKKRKREIDVLVQGSLAGVSIRIPIECKDYKNKVGVGKIDAFIGALADVGLPSAPSVFVAASGFTQDALDRAAEVGMITRVLKEVRRDTSKEMISSALQRVVFLLAHVTSIGWQDNIGDYRAFTKTPKDALEVFAFFDDVGQLVGSVPDLVWRAWCDGEPGSIIGEYELSLEIPEGWHRFVKGEAAPLEGVHATVSVVGLVVTLPGSLSVNLLIDPATGETERSELSAAFNNPESPIPVQTFSSEEGLTKHLQQHSSAGFFADVGRIRLPRILLKDAFWPLSQKAHQKIQELARESGELPAEVSFKDIEGNDLSAVWDPVIAGHRGCE